MIPDTMGAAVIDRFGKPEVVSIRTVPVPSLDTGEVLIAVHASGIASWDVEMREGWWPSGRPHFPLILGSDGSGTVAAVGSRVRRFAIGDAVYAFSFANPKGGFHAEYVAVPAASVAHVPRGLDMLHAGAVPAAGLTALEGIDGALGVKRGEAIIIHAASGSIGSLALQFAKRRGARVLATASGRDGVDLVRRLGADAAVDGKRGNIRKAADAFAPDGVDAVLAFAGGPALTQCLEALRPGGRLAYPNGLEPAPRKRRGLEVTAFDAASDARAFTRLGRAIEAAPFEVPIAATFPLADAAKAHRRFDKGHLLGRVMLRIR
jgi:NADPH2:quinone reductase